MIKWLGRKGSGFRIAAMIAAVLVVLAGPHSSAVAGSRYHTDHADSRHAHLRWRTVSVKPMRVHTRSPQRVKRHWNRAQWHCNPWHGTSTLRGPLFKFGQGYRHGSCHPHRTGVDRDWRRVHHRELGTHVAYSRRTGRKYLWRYRSMAHYIYWNPTSNWHDRQHTPGRRHD